MNTSWVRVAFWLGAIGAGCSEGRSELDSAKRDLDASAPLDASTPVSVDAQTESSAEEPDAGRDEPPPSLDAGQPRFADAAVTALAGDSGSHDAATPVEVVRPKDGGVDAGFTLDPRPDAALSPSPLSLLPPRTISVGATHACALDEEGTAWCWGNNNFGQLGDGSLESSAEPVEAVRGVVEIGVGVSHSCALLDDGTVSCWGDNAWGQLGSDEQEGGEPRAVQGLPPAIALSVGGYHACAILDDGSVNCWGRNEDGQLGNESTISSRTPVEVVVLEGVVRIAAAEASNCALSRSGQIHCWGNDDEGQLGWDRNDVATTAPIELVGEYSGVVAISLGPHNGCAVLDVGVVACWGTNRYGQLGAGLEPTPMSRPPVQVAEIDDAVDVATGEFHSCALHADGTVSCWGDGFFGSLGSPLSPAAPLSTIPLGVPSLAGVTELQSGGFLGGNSNCARVLDEALACWGRGSAGQLGDGTFEDRGEPVSVLGF